jgi:hypothetical protein
MTAMTTTADHDPARDATNRDSAARADRRLLAGSRAAAARRALHDTAPTAPPRPANTPVELARIVVEASTLDLDVDRVGEELHVFAGRVELLDRTGRATRTVDRDQLTAVKVRKRLRSATLTIRSTGETIVMKGLDPNDAEAVRDDLLGLDRPPTRASEALQHLADLAAAGLLDDKDLAAKRSQLMRNTGP